MHIEELKSEKKVQRKYAAFERNIEKKKKSARERIYVENIFSIERELYYPLHAMKTDGKIVHIKDYFCFCAPFFIWLFANFVAHNIQFVANEKKATTTTKISERNRE